jgi:predicted O-linked N-acetylglucosamine transferase (SPINDLY family)
VGQATRAIDLAQRVLARAPDRAVESLLAWMLAETGQFAAALEQIEASARAAPLDRNEELLYADVLSCLRRYDQALAVLRPLTQSADANPQAWLLLLGALMRTDRLDDAAQAADQLLDRTFEGFDAYSVLRNLENADLTEPLLGVLERLRQRRPPSIKFETIRTMVMHYSPGVSGANLFEALRGLGTLYGQAHPADVHPFTNDPSPQRPLHVAMVSPDLRDSPVGRFIEPILQHHDRRAFSMHCYQNSTTVDDLTKRASQLADSWTVTADWTDRELTDRIRAAQVDIFIDLCGHAGMNRLVSFCQRAAPVQVTYCGYPSTTGLPTMDCRIVDALTDPPGQDLATETLWRLDPCFLCYSAPPNAPRVEPAPCMRPEAPVTFGSFNALSTFNDQVLAAWVSIVKAAPNASLLLKDRRLSDSAHRERLRRRLIDMGLDSERVEFLGESPTTAERMDAYRRVDIALDPFPFNGASSTCEALWMGVPVVALSGNDHRSRVGMSLLSAAGLAEFIAPDLEAYRSLALELAADRAALSRLRSTLRRRVASSSLCDAVIFTRRFEAALRGMWRAWCARQSPRPA